MKAPLALTTGEPAGIGPDLAVTWAQRAREASVVVVGDPGLLRSRAKQLGLELNVVVLERVIEPMLRAREALRSEYHALHRAVLGIVRQDDDLPSADDGAGRRCAGGDHLHLGGRRAGPVHAIAHGGRSLRAHAEEVPVRRDRRHRRDQQGGRRDGAERALRGGERDADPGQSVLDPEALGHGGRQAPRHEAGEGGARPQARHHPAPDVGRRHRASASARRSAAA